MDLAAGGLAISIVTYGELYERAFYARDASALSGLMSFLEGVEVLPLTIRIVELFATVRGSLSRNVRQQIGDFDLLTAATALVHSCTLLTYNRKDFDLITGVLLY